MTEAPRGHLWQANRKSRNEGVLGETQEKEDDKEEREVGAQSRYRVGSRLGSREGTRSLRLKLHVAGVGRFRVDHNSHIRVYGRDGGRTTSGCCVGRRLRTGCGASPEGVLCCMAIRHTPLTFV